MAVAHPRTVFMGSPEFAVPTLSALAAEYPVVGVVTQPDRPSGRGRKLTPPAVKLLALELGLPLIQPPRLRLPEAMDQLHTWQPELIVVAAFGQILRPEVLDLPRFGCLNVHASLLPRWRGAAPIPAAILNGDSQTGVTIMRLDAGVDTGPLLGQRAISIQPDDTAGSLNGRLAALGADLLLDALPGYLSGTLPPLPQDDSLATYAPTLQKKDGELNFEQSIRELDLQVRAMNPWPGAYTSWRGQPLKIHRVNAISADQTIHELVSGVHLVFQGKPAIKASDGILILEEVQPAGKKSMPGKAFLQGVRDWA
jgi:methionyl-tRNA formyltransferase